MAVSKVVDTGWSWVVMASSFMVLLLVGGVVFASGIFNVMFLETFDRSKSLTAWIASIQAALLCFTGPIASVVCNRLGCRPCVWIGTFLVMAGLILSAFATGPPFLMGSFGIIAGVGMGFVYTPSIVIMGYYFEEKYVLANSIVNSGAGTGILLLAPAITGLNNFYSWRGTMLILAGAMAHQWILGAVMRPHARESKVTSNSFSFSVCKSRPFFLLCCSLFMGDLAVASILVHFTAYVIRLGTSKMAASIMMSLVGGANIAGRLLAGALCSGSRVKPMILYISAFGIAGISTILFPQYSFSRVGQFIFSFIFGMFGNNSYAVLAPITKDIVGLEGLSSAYGLILWYSGLAYLIGPPLTGWLYDLTSSYDGSFYLAGTLYSAASVIALGLYSLYRKLKQDKKCSFKDDFVLNGDVKCHLKGDPINDPCLGRVPVTPAEYEC